GVSAPCNLAFGGVDADPWLQLTLEAVPSATEVPGAATLTASLLENSAGQEPSDARALPAMEIALDEVTGTGQLSAPAITTVEGTASASIASSTAGRAEVHAQLDYAEAVASVQFGRPPTP